MRTLCEVREIVKDWVQPQLAGGGYVHLDATYWGHDCGVMLALDGGSGNPLYMAFIAHEKVQDYVEPQAVHLWVFLGIEI